jgi:putative DNA primase/helicase
VTTKKKGRRTGAAGSDAGEERPAMPAADPRIASELRHLHEAEQPQFAEQELEHPAFDKLSGPTGGREVVLGMARRFLCDEEGVPTLVFYQGTPYAYSEKLWVKCSDDDVLTLISSMLYPCRMRVSREGDAPAIVPYPTSQAVVNEVAFQLPRILSIPSSYTAPCHWEASLREEVRFTGKLGEWHPVNGDGKMVCRGALVNMITGDVWSNHDVFVPNGPKWKYNAKAPKPKRWLEFLDSIKLDAESIGLLQEWFGYVLSGDLWAQKGLIITGPPRAGKGIIGHILSELVGQLMVASPALHTLGREFGLEQLLNKRLCLVSDARLSNRIDAAAVIESLLRIVAGDSVDVARKFRDALNLVLGVRVMILSNEMPQLSDNSNAINTRFLILELTESFLGREKTGLKDALLEELPSIGLWAMTGYQRLRARGAFLEPESSETARQHWFEENNPLAQFVEDCCDVKQDGGDSRKWLEVKTTDLYHIYEDWAKLNGMSVMAAHAFSRRLVGTFGPKVGRDKKDHVRIFTGIALKPKYYDADGKLKRMFDPSTSDNEP